jgi:hypothetical protein
MHPSHEEASLMLLTIGIILVATIAVAALEVWLFWLAGERVDRRRGSRRDPTPTTNEPDSDDCSRPSRRRPGINRYPRWISQSN